MEQTVMHTDWSISTCGLMDSKYQTTHKICQGYWGWIDETPLFCHLYTRHAVERRGCGGSFKSVDSKLIYKDLLVAKIKKLISNN